MKKYQTLLIFLLALFLTSCNKLHLTTPNKFADITPQITVTEPHKVKTQDFAQLSDDNEVVILLRPLDENKIDIIGVNANCFYDLGKCEIKTIIQLPKSMPQILKIYWLNDGIHALFWDSGSGNIYKLNRLISEIQLFKEKVWKTQGDFFLSPDGKSVLCDLQKNEFENGIVLLNVNSGETTTLNININGMKRIAKWLSNDRFLFWTEVYSGQKGYLEDIDVYTFDISTQRLQIVDLGVDWLSTTPPYYSPDMKTFIISTKESIFYYDKDNNKINTININKENYLWSPDSAILAVYTQEKNIFFLKENGNEEKQIFTVPKEAVLSDWFWLPGTDDLLFVICNIDDGKTSLIKYSLSNDLLTKIDWPILTKENIVSLSYRSVVK